MYNTNGYYLFDPAFYEDLAAANGYEVLFSSFMVSAPSPMKESANHSWTLPLSMELLNVMDWTRLESINVFYVMRKTSDESFRIPYQGKYMSAVYGNDGYECVAATNYRHPSRKYVPIVDRFSNVSTKVFKKTCKEYFKKKLGLK
jgi:hypothetical protein